MKELRAICDAYRKIDFTKQKAAIATVVRVIGSAYRSPGARMLITDDGRWVGSISGGCLEGDALRKARGVMNDKKAITVTYDTSEEENKTFAINLGCNGIIDVLLEPVDPEDKSNPIFLFETLLDLEEDAALATCFRGKDGMPGKKMLMKNKAVVFQDFNDNNIRRRVESDLSGLFETRTSRAETYYMEDGITEVFIELIQPPTSLIIFGGGFDARPLSQMAKNLGWSVTVTDECVAHIVPVFFPDADNLSLCQRQFVEHNFKITANTACVLMSHNYDYDRDVLKTLLKTEARYIGILGPRKRFDKMQKEFANQNILLSDNDWDRIHAPIGIDIGAEAPDEIAIAIIAEIMGKLTNREAGFLKYRKAPIHLRDTTSEQVLKEAKI
ncbi:MAG TPA: XdhC family protein [Cytophagales bacterium]|nr:XdhC family protein [Cytophagales bacterium]